MTRKKWSFLFTVCLVTALIGCGQKNSQVDKNNSEELNKLGQIQVISREEGSGTRDTFASLAGFNKDGACLLYTSLCAAFQTYRCAG